MSNIELTIEQKILDLVIQQDIVTIDMPRHVVIENAFWVDGREVEIRNNGTFIQWRYVWDIEWIDLVSLEDITWPQWEQGIQWIQGIQGEQWEVWPQWPQWLPWTTDYNELENTPENFPPSPHTHIFNTSEIMPEWNYDMGINTFSASFAWQTVVVDMGSDTEDLDTLGVYTLFLDFTTTTILGGVINLNDVVGRHLYMLNTWGRVGIIANESWESNEENRFLNPWDWDIRLSPWEWTHYIYDSDISRWRYCWKYVAPSGSSSEIQYKSWETLAWASRTKIDVDSGTINLVAGTDPDTPAAWNLLLYSKNIAGKIFPKVKWPSGLDYPLQESFRQNNIYMFSLTTAATWSWMGTSGSSNWTMAISLPTTTNLYTSIKRGRYSNVVTTLNQTLWQRNNELLFFRWNQPSMWGFFFCARCGMDTWTNGGRFIGGMFASTSIVTADPSTFNNTVWFCVDAADNGAISFLTRGASATKVSTWFTMATNVWYDLYIFAAPNSSQISWRIVKINDGTEASGVATANLPASTTMLYTGVMASNGALTPVNSIQLWLNRIYVSTDY